MFSRVGEGRGAVWSHRRVSSVGPGRPGRPGVLPGLGRRTSGHRVRAPREWGMVVGGSRSL